MLKSVLLSFIKQSHIANVLLGHIANVLLYSRSHCSGEVLLVYSYGNVFTLLISYNTLSTAACGESMTMCHWLWLCSTGHPVDLGISRVKTTTIDCSDQDDKHCTHH